LEFVRTESGERGVWAKEDLYEGEAVNSEGPMLSSDDLASSWLVLSKISPKATSWK
jgi:hypothetical protein